MKYWMMKKEEIHTFEIKLENQPISVSNNSKFSFILLVFEKSWGVNFNSKNSCIFFKKKNPLMKF
jgi:hypothetical protein